jgi:hypothetical protein
MAEPPNWMLSNTVWSRFDENGRNIIESARQRGDAPSDVALDVILRFSDPDTDPYRGKRLACELAANGARVINVFHLIQGIAVTASAHALLEAMNKHPTLVAETNSKLVPC